MDRQSLLERLDAARPDSNDLFLSELSDARAELVRDSELAAEFRRRQDWDRAMSVLIHDVPVPEGLKDRLLAGLEQSEPPRPAKPAARMSRRRVLAAMSGLAASLVAAGLLWSILAASQPSLATADLHAAAATFLDGSGVAEPFDGRFTPQLPTGKWQRLPVGEPLGFLPDADGVHRAAGWQFVFGPGKRQRGVIIATPVADVASPPTAKWEYVGGNAVAWTQGEFVYVCRVEGSIDQLLRQLDDARFV